MESISKQTEYPCSGCGACAAVCPNGAIRLEPDSVGLLIAKVDRSLCVDCGLCIKVCTRYSEAAEGADLRYSKLYAVQSADAETVMNCSSGGFAHELAVWAVQNGGKAVGAVYDIETDKVFHEIVCNEQSIKKLDGSKYLQSDTQEAYAEAVRAARTDPETRFTVFGTPCQITGLAKVCDLLNLRERFLLVEIFCHGVPPYPIWEQQMVRMRKKLGQGHFDEVRFRYKKDGWHSYCIKVSSGGKLFYGPREREPFWHVYFENVLLGDACMTCRLRKEYSLADLRIGDYWGKRYQNRNDGVSAVFACTERGKAVVDELISSCKLYSLDAGTPEEMLKAQNMDGYSEAAKHEETMELLKNGVPVSKAVKYYRRRDSAKLRIKRALLHLCSILPAGFKAKLKRANIIRNLR